MAIVDKKVELIELFYDLIFVYAISRLTTLIREPVNGIMHPFFVYLIISFVIIQVWLYFTNYINRYGKWEVHDYILTVVNMIAVIYMANTINTQWNQMALPFNISMLVMFLTVIGLYYIHDRRQENKNNAAHNSIKIIIIVCMIYIVALIALFSNNLRFAIWIDAVAVVVGAFLPFLSGDFDKGIVNFPHLVERFELLTIITFGEAIVGMTYFFDITSLNLRSFFVFFIVLSLFATYVIQIHRLMDHHREERGFKLMFTHYFIIISINLMTVIFELLHSGKFDPLFESIVMIISLIVFYISLMANKSYYKEGVVFTRNDSIKMIICIAAGSLIMLLFNNTPHGFLLGALVIACGNFIVLVQIQQKFLK
ncbi:low temperature requirement protein A [uncultured Methanobrevibacter sp.]|uniref:low temperature requirement protein A n=1 Tax=uncultured Methanobrevibacter sp. TaxID=253161 RepID=UPI00260A8C10|nr:low temperature requirement protein A [uncultured Methanobrevibacter sp.]